MSFYVRKSVSAGPFRFNFSKAGVGVSIGVKGLRFGSGPRGHYIHAGRGGLYYRVTLNNASQDRNEDASNSNIQSNRAESSGDGVSMVDIESGDVMHMRDASFSELLEEVNRKASQTRMSLVFPLTVLLVTLLLSISAGGGVLLLCIIAFPAWVVGKWLDSFRRTTVLFYDLEGDAEVAYGSLATAFEELARCKGKWHIPSGGAVQDLKTWKRHAGASHLVTRKSIGLTFRLPAVIKSNISSPALAVGKQVLFFMPDVVLVQVGSRFGVVSYLDLRVNCQPSSFIETQPVPSDAKIINYTWKHPNKSGGPDRRFKYNPQIPICLYEAVHISSYTGVNELLEFSRTGIAGAFAKGCRMLAALPRQGDCQGATVPQLANPVSPVAVPKVERSPSNVSVAIMVAIFSAIAIILVSNSPFDRIYQSNNPNSSSAESMSRVEKATQETPPANDASVKAALQRSVLDKTGSNQTLVRTGGEQSEPAVVRYTKSAVNLREGPGTGFAIIVVLPRGSEVLVLEAKGEWRRVRVNLNTVGWVATSTISER